MNHYCQDEKTSQFSNLIRQKQSLYGSKQKNESNNNNIKTNDKNSTFSFSTTVMRNAHEILQDIKGLERQLDEKTKLANQSLEAALLACGGGDMFQQMQRDATLDQSTADALSKANQQVDSLKKLIDVEAPNEQAREHSALLVFSLLSRLDHVQTLWNKLRMSRINLQETASDLSMFNNNNDEEELNFDKNQTKNINNNNNIDDDIDDTNNNDNNDNDDNDETISTTKRRKNNTSRKSKLANKPMRLTGASGAVGDEKRDEHDTSLHQQQQHTLALENRDLLGMLRNDVDQARGLEQSVAKIGTLQRVFATKLSEQAEQISHIHHTIVGATDAVSRGNDQLAQAAAHGVDFRVFVLLFLLVCSFALIFLDNYE